MDGTRLVTESLATDSTVTAILSPTPRSGEISTRLLQNTPSIAVLPFANMSNDPENEYFCDGLAEELIGALAKVEGLKVAARTSAFSFKGKDANVEEIGRVLHVDTVLEGSVRKSGERLRIMVQLVSASGGYHLWSERYDRVMRDIFDVQDEITLSVAETLKVKLLGAGKAVVLKRHTDDSEAYHLYLKGRFYWNKRTAEAFEKAIGYFNQAIERDPDYAPAYAGLADTYVLLPIFAAGSPRDSFTKAEAAARRALEIDELLAEAHTALAHALIKNDWNFAESNREFLRAIELNPAYPTARQWYGLHHLAATGRFDEAIAEGRLAQQLDPLSLITNAELGVIYIMARQYDRAVEQLRKTHEMDQGFYYAHWRLGTAYVVKGSFQDAILEYQRARQLNDDPQVLALLGHAYAASGERGEGLKTLDQLVVISKQRYVSAYSFVLIYEALGEKDRAFQWLEQGYQNRDWQMNQLKVDPMLDDLRTDARFTDLVRRVGLPQ